MKLKYAIAKATIGQRLIIAFYRLKAFFKIVKPEKEWEMFTCPCCGHVNYEMFEYPNFVTETSGTVPGSPYSPPIHWVKGKYTCPICKFTWDISDSN